MILTVMMVVIAILINIFIAYHFKKYLQLIEFNRLKADKYIDQLLSIQNMENDLAVQAAHERTDIEVTKEMKKHDDDIMNDDSEWE